jgi:demethylmenaquinone methyltransferase/2-methoxy-6-polyprenyl-1,4-benzoquinol methylase
VLPEPVLRADGSGAMFNQIAARYDLLNRIMSFGLDGLWRRRLVHALNLKPHQTVLDAATGTADVALAIWKFHPTVKVTGLDPSAGMLAIGHKKVALRGGQNSVSLVEGDAQHLPFAAATFDAACISFGIRNVPDRLAGIKEMARVCKPGAKVVVLELSEPRESWLGPLARFHVHTVVPALGALISNKKEYRYLQQSIAAFMSPPEFMALLGKAGLTKLSHRPMSFGAVNLFTAEVPKESGASA